jgi:hypothetical protein
MHKLSSVTEVERSIPIWQGMTQGENVTKWLENDFWFLVAHIWLLGEGNLFAWGREFHRSVVTSVEKFDQFSLVLLASQLIDSVEMKDRRIRLRTVKNCFIGSHAAAWLIKSKHCSSLDEAVQVGNLMMKVHTSFDDSGERNGRTQNRMPTSLTNHRSQFRVNDNFKSFWDVWKAIPRGGPLFFDARVSCKDRQNPNSADSKVRCSAKEIRATLRLLSRFGKSRQKSARTFDLCEDWHVHSRNEGGEVWSVIFLKLALPSWCM